MNDPKSPNVCESQQKMVAEQMTSQGVEITPSSSSKAEQVNKELAEESGQKDASWKPEPATETEGQGEGNDYSYGLGQ